MRLKARQRTLRHALSEISCATYCAPSFRLLHHLFPFACLSPRQNYAYSLPLAFVFFCLPDLWCDACSTAMWEDEVRWLCWAVREDNARLTLIFGFGFKRTISTHVMLRWIGAENHIYKASCPKDARKKRSGGGALLTPNRCFSRWTLQETQATEG